MSVDEKEINMKKRDSISRRRAIFKNPTLHLENTDKRTRYLLKKRIESFNFEDVDVDEIRDREELKLNNIINILLKDRIDRNQREVYLVAKYLEKSDIGYKFKDDQIEDLDLKKFIKICASLIIYRRLNKGEVLFQEGDVGDRFYIILDGSVKVMKAMEKEVYLTGIDYLQHLIDLKNKNENYLLKKTIKANYIAFPVDKRNLDEINEIIKNIKQKYALVRSITPEDIQKILNETYNSEDENISQNSLPKKISKVKINESDMLKIFNISFCDRIKLKIYEYEEFVQLQKGKYFGDVALEKKNNLRTASIEATNVSHLGEIYIEDYFEFLMDEKKKIKQKEISFLVFNFFFKHVRSEYFESHYFNNFIYQDLRKGETLFQQNESSDNIYFIKEGEVSLTSYLSLDGICNLIDNLSEKIRMKVKKLERIDFGFNQGISENEKLQYLKNKEEVLICQSKQTLCLEESYYELKKLYTAEVTTPVLKYYKISKELLFKIMKNDKITNKEMHNYINVKLGALVLRLIDLRNNTFQNIICNLEKEIEKNNKERSALMITEVKSRNIKSSVPNFNSTVSFNTISQKPSMSGFSTIKPEELKVSTSDRRLILSKNESNSSLINCSLKSRSSNNLISAKCLPKRRNTDVTYEKKKLIFFEANKTVKMTRPKSNLSYNNFLTQKLTEKFILKSQSAKAKTTVKLKNRTLHTIHSKDYSLKDSENTDRTRTPFLTSNGFSKFRHKIKSSVDKYHNINCINRQIQQQDIFFTRIKNVSVVKIDGNQIKGKNNSNSNIFRKKSQFPEAKMSLKLFPSFNNINKEFLNIKYRRINHVNKMKLLSTSKSKK